MDKLIRTTSKFKLPKDLSYPIGAEEISEQLRDVHQFEQLTLTFFESSRTFMGDFKKDLTEKRNITVLKVTFRPALSGPSAPRYSENEMHGENWAIYVYPVPRDKRNTVRSGLKEHGMKKVHEWLSSSNHPSWRLSRKQLNVKYDLSENRLNYSEDIDKR